MILTQQERDSPMWEKLRAYAEKRIATLRAKNDNDLSAEETASIRGQIREAKAFLSLGNEKPEFASPGAKPKG